jgi:Ca2+-binding EF-hand superfamily protein
MNAGLEERKTALIAAFRALDSKKTGKVRTALVLQLVQRFDPNMTDGERTEFEQEADSGGVIEYERFVKDVLFGKSKQ